MIEIIVLVVAVVAAVVFGLVYRARSGSVRLSNDAASPQVHSLLLDAGVRTGETTVLHFSADWCGPCAAVRRVVGQVLATVEGPVELEVDIDACPELARAMGVLSLPTTFVLDADLTEIARIAGVPKADALRAALRS